MSEMMVLDHSGDTRIIWDSESAAETKAAREHFESLMAKQYLAFRAEGKDGLKGDQIKKFDPSAERLILVPRMVGG
jgi:hypothetical protein